MAAPLPPVVAPKASVRARLAVLAGAVALGLALQQLVGGRLAEIAALSERDLLAARAELATLMRVVGGGALLLTAATGAVIVAAGRRSLALGVFPPPGLLAWGARAGPVPLRGDAARRGARVGIALGAAVLLLSLVALGLLWHLTSVLLACRAGV